MLSRGSQEEKKPFTIRFDYLSNPIMNSNTEPLVTMRKQRLQVWILSDMNLNGFQKQCRIHSKDAKKFEFFLTDHFQQARSTSQRKPHHQCLPQSNNFIWRGYSYPDIYSVVKLNWEYLFRVCNCFWAPASIQSNFPILKAFAFSSLAVCKIHCSRRVTHKMLWKSLTAKLKAN